MAILPAVDTGRLVETYRSYAHAIAAEVLRKLLPTVEKDEIQGAAVLGLVEAASVFDPNRKVRFKTFAYYRIQGAIYDHLRKAGWISRPQYHQFRFEASANEYMKDLAETAAPEGTPEQELEDLKTIAGPITSCYLLSLESVTQEIPEKSPLSPESQSIEKHDRGWLPQSLAPLPAKSRQVIEAYYLGGASFEEIGQKLGLSRSWICRLHARSLEMVRDLLEKPGSHQVRPAVCSNFSKGDLRDPAKADQAVRAAFEELIASGLSDGLKLPAADQKSIAGWMSNDPILRDKILKYLEGY